MKKRLRFFKENGKGLLLCLLIALPVWILTKEIKSLELVGAPIREFDSCI